MRYTGWLILFLGLTYNVVAQDATAVTGDFKNATIEEFVQQLEHTIPYHFFYNPTQLDSLRITVSVKNQPLQKVLQLAFENNAGYHFAIDDRNNVFITKGLVIQTSLRPDPFDKENASGGQNNQNNNEISNYLNDKKRGAKEVTSENKLYDVGIKSNTIGQGTATLSGYIRNTKTGEPIVNASIFVDQVQLGTSTDQYGYFSLALPKGRHILNIQGLGMKDSKYQVMVYSDGKLNMDLADQVVSLKEVVVSAQKVANINRVQSGIEKLSIQTIKQVPTVFGEADILRVVLTLPGVKTVGEASTGFNVRGGSADQNLILFNDATIYNPSHFFGLFSAFNPDVVKDIELYKSSIPAKYGGRLSSVLDITGREGNKKEYSGTAGIGLLTSRFNLEGPITKDKTSFVLGGRTTYANWLFNLLPDQYKNSRASFYDVNLGISHQINAKNNIYFTGYISNDHFNLNSDTAYSYSNKNISVKWKHAFSNKLNGVFTTGLDRYNYNISSDKNPVNAYKLAFDVNQLNFKSDFNYYFNTKHIFDFGASAIRYTLHPGSYNPVGKASLVNADIMPAEQGLESALYIADRYNFSPKASFNAGIRFSAFTYLGPQDINIYAAGLPKETTNITGTKTYANSSFIKTYGGPEYRFSFRYAFTNSFSIKGGYNSSRQYIHVLSNTAAIAPTDVWKLSDPNIKPQLGQQVSLGVYKNLKSNTIETSLEVYYKKINDYLDYKPGANLVLNHHVETDVMNTKGKAYGVEVMIKKSAGKLNGWISYTYSRTFLKMDDPTIAEPVNNGAYYPANYDKPHDVTVISNFKVNHRFSLSLNGTYSTGRPITLPIGRYYYAGAQRVLYSDRNAYRIPDYFRTDFSMNIEGNHKVHQLTHNSWTLGVYNLTGRRNAYSVYFVTENGVINSYKLSIFGSAIPFINYNIRF